MLCCQLKHELGPNCEVLEIQGRRHDILSHVMMSPNNESHHGLRPLDVAMSLTVNWCCNEEGWSSRCDPCFWQKIHNLVTKSKLPSTTIQYVHQVSTSLDSKHSKNMLISSTSIFKFLSRHLLLIHKLNLNISYHCNLFFNTKSSNCQTFPMTCYNETYHFNLYTNTYAHKHIYSIQTLNMSFINQD